MTDIEKVKPCPFCGSAVELAEREYAEYAGNYFTNCFSIIECKNCGIAMKVYPKNTYGTTREQKEELVKKWNRRAN